MKSIAILSLLSGNAAAFAPAAVQTNIFANQSGYCGQTIEAGVPKSNVTNGPGVDSRHNILASTAMVTDLTASRKGAVVTAMLLFASLLAGLVTTQRQRLMKLLTAVTPLETLSSLTRKLWQVQAKAEPRYPSSVAAGKTVLVTTGRQAKTRVLHVFGSTSSEYYHGVSRYYMKSAWENLVSKEPESMHGEYEHFILQGHPDGTWSMPKTPSNDDLKDVPTTTLAGAMDFVSKLDVDVVIPHMFCYQGMTTCRGIFQLLRLPVVGNGADAMALSTNKWHTRAIMASAGVPVAEGELLRKGDVPQMSPPFILKPNREDNSQGIKLYRGGDEASLSKALDHAFQFDKEVICEAFVPLGHELRIAVLEDDRGEPNVALPIIEYVMDRSGEGVRTPEDKLQTDDRGVPTIPTACRRDLPAVNVPEGILQKCREEAFKAHRALGCKDYSIYDIRVSPDGTPYFLEASLYCSFAETSAIVLMDLARGSSARDLFDRLVRRTRQDHEEKERAKAEGGAQLLGML